MKPDVKTRIDDIWLVRKVDLLSSVLKDPQIPVVHKRVPPSKCLRNWLLSTGGPGSLVLSSLLLPSFSLALPHPSQKVTLLQVSMVCPALPLVLIPHFSRNTIPDARVQRRGPYYRYSYCCQWLLFTYLSAYRMAHQKLNLSQS